MDTAQANGHKRLISYRRVSTQDQKDYGYGLDTQFKDNTTYASRNDITIAVDLDEDYSGFVPLGERPKGKTILAMLRRKEADGLLVHRVDRLSRDLVDVLIVVREITRSGLEIHFADIGRITSEDDIQLVINAWQAQNGGKEIVTKLANGKTRKANRNKVVGCGRPPYGYRVIHERVNDGTSRIVNSYFEPIAEEATIVQLIFKWYTEGDGRNGPLGSFSIAKQLTGLKIPVPSKHNRSGEWNIVQIRHILSNETYAGLWHYGKQIGRCGKGGKRAAAEQIAVDVPALVSRETWQAAQDRRDYNVTHAKRNTHNNYLLRGMIRCACGYTLIGRTLPQRGYQSYRCSSQLRRLTVTDRTCRQCHINGRIVEAKVWDWVLGIISNPAELEQNLREAQAAAFAELEPKRDDLDHINALIEKAENELDDNLALMKGLDEKSRRYKKLRVEGDEIEARLNELETRQAEIETILQSQIISDEDIRDILQFRKDAEIGLNHPTFEDKRSMLEILKVQVEVKGKQALARCRLPVEPGTFELTTSRGYLPKGTRYVILTSPPLDLAAEFFSKARRVILAESEAMA